MAPAINELSLTRVKYTGKELEIQWVLDEGKTGKGTKYTYEIAIGSTTEQTNSFTDETGARTQTISFTPKDENAIYTLKLYVTDQPNTSDKCVLTMGTYKNIKGSFDGERFNFTWEVSDNMMTDGYCKILDASSNDKELLHIPVQSFNRRLESDLLNLNASGAVKAVFVASDGEVTAGPDSDPLYFVPLGVEIHEADITEGTAKNSKKLSLKIAYVTNPKLSAKILLKKDKRQVYCSDALPITAPSSDKIDQMKETKDAGSEATVETEIAYTKVRPEVLSQCVATCIYVSGDAQSDIYTEQSEISLAVPTIKPIVVGEECKARLSIKSEIEPTGFEFSDGSVLATEEGVCPPDFIARARYDSESGSARRGPSSSKGFPECFYADDTTVYYRKSDFNEKSQEITLSPDLFSSDFASVEKTGLSLVKNTEGTVYTLKILTDAALDAAQYQEFLASILQPAQSGNDERVKPQGFYQICETILRMGAYKKSDMAVFQCQYQPEKRTADIMPGLFLRSETAMQMPQYKKNTVSSGGLVWANSSEIQAYFNKSAVPGGKGLLEWNHFASEIFRYSDTALAAKSGEIIYAAGTEDLIRQSVYQPYYRIMYPSSIQNVDESIPYASENIVLLAADQYTKILDASNSILENEAAINNLNIPVIVFRGRGMLSLLTQICINGEICRVPVGCTLEQVLASRGINSLSQVKLYRRGINGNELRVYGNLEGILPLQGDRVEV